MFIVLSPWPQGHCESSLEWMNGMDGWMDEWMNEDLFQATQAHKNTYKHFCSVPLQQF